MAVSPAFLLANACGARELVNHRTFQDATSPGSPRLRRIATWRSRPTVCLSLIHISEPTRR
eukprot:4595881-Lingulodinium_polyedra.AAC.1